MRTKLMKTNDLPTPKKCQHFPMSLNSNGCNIDVLTPQQAIATGLLPKDCFLDVFYTYVNPIFCFEIYIITII